LQIFNELLFCEMPALLTLVVVVLHVLASSQEE